MEKNKNSILENALVDFENITKIIQENSTKQVKEILSEAVKSELKNIIKEADEYDEEDEDTEDLDGMEDNGLDDTEPETDIDDVEDETETDVEDTEMIDAEPEIVDGEDEIDGEEDSEFDEFISDDGGYDLTGSNFDDVIKVFKKVTNDDSIIVKKLEDGMVDVKDTENDQEYIIDTNGEGDVDDMDEEIEIEIDGEEENGETCEECNEEVDQIIEIELEDGEELGANEEGEGMVDEKSMSTSISHNRRTGVLSQTRAANAPGANNRDGSQLVKNSTNEAKLKATYEKRINEVKAKYNDKLKSINEELAQYKQALTMFSDKLKENAVLNNNLGKYTKLIIENATTKDEKVEILKRFSNEANSIEAGNKLYESISNQLNKKTSPEIGNKLDKQFSVGQNQMITEKVVYQNNELNGMKDLMNRMSKI